MFPEASVRSCGLVAIVPKEVTMTRHKCGMTSAGLCFAFGLGCDLEDERQGSRAREADLSAENDLEAGATTEAEVFDESRLQGPMPADSSTPRDEPTESVATENVLHGGGSPTCSEFPFFAIGYACEWTRNTTGSSQNVRADCGNVGASYRAISGGCWTDSASELVYAGVDEDIQGNYPDEGENLADGYGYSCRYSRGPTGSEQHLATALCCPQLTVAGCT
jgi:hypothetical protein